MNTKTNTHATNPPSATTAHALSTRSLRPWPKRTRHDFGEPWTEPERAILREHFEKPGGVAICEALLPTRSPGAIRHEGADLGLKVPRARGQGRGNSAVPRWELLLRALADLAPEHCGAVPLAALVERAFERSPAEFGWHAPARDELLPDTHAVLSALHRSGPIERGYMRALCEGVYGITEEGRAAIARAPGTVPKYAGDEAADAERQKNLARAAEIRRARAAAAA